MEASAKVFSKVLMVSTMTETQSEAESWFLELTLVFPLLARLLKSQNSGESLGATWLEQTEGLNHQR